jgi:hypothetical protein
MIVHRSGQRSTTLVLVAMGTIIDCMLRRTDFRCSAIPASLLAIALASCGADTDDPAAAPPSDGRSNETGGAVAQRGAPDPTEPADCDVGDRRDAVGSEAAEAEYCVCEAAEDIGKVWRCYGPSPDAPRPKASCSWTFVQPGDAASCFVSWSECSDAHIYSLSCVNEFCVCLVDGNVGAELEPGTRCPEGLGELNDLCGWSLR